MRPLDAGLVNVHFVISIGIGNILPTVCMIYILELDILATLNFMQRHE